MLKINNFKFHNCNYFDFDDFIAVDASIEPTKLDSFLKFCEEFGDSGELFDFSINNQPYKGRMGKLIFDKNGKMRFYLVTKENERFIDPQNLPILENNVAYYNVIRAMKHLETNNKLLLELLVQNDIISKKDISEFKPFIPFRNGNYYIDNEVNNLETYLNDTYDTIEDLKKSDES